MNRAQKLQDPALFFLACLASLVGLFIIYDAGYARSIAMNKGFLGHEFIMQAIFLPIAMGLSYLVGSLRPELFRKLAVWVWAASLLLLVGVEVAGHAQNGAARWINIGPIMVQPSEFAKLATIVFLASLLADRKPWPTNLKPRKNTVHWLDTIFVPKLARALPGIGVLISILLIEHGKDLGTAAVVAVIGFMMFIMAGVSRKSLIVCLVVAIGGCVVMVKKEPYRMDRVTNHLQRWSRQNVDDVGYQTVQSELGMAAGGVLGVGIGNGRTKHVLPATTTDFIMATVGEEFGLLGSLFVLAVVGSIVWRMFYLAQRVKSRYAMLVLGGVAVWFGFQACVNVMMANGFLPAIGIPLPFISSGGSSLIALWLAIGVCQSSLAPSPAKEESIAPSSHRWRDRRTHLSSA